MENDKRDFSFFYVMNKEKSWNWFKKAAEKRYTKIIQKFLLRSLDNARLILLSA